jgi:hypothetical protein
MLVERSVELQAIGQHDDRLWSALAVAPKVERMRS